MSQNETCCFDGVGAYVSAGTSSIRSVTGTSRALAILSSGKIHILIVGRGFEKPGDLDKLIKLVYKLITLVFVLAWLDAEKKRTGKREHDEDNSF
jgi:hypothetical protein